MQAATKAFGKIDGIIVNHGVLDPLTKIAGGDAEAWRKSYDINFFSAVGLVRSRKQTSGFQNLGAHK